MTIEQIKEMIGGKEYDFLRTNPHLKNRMMFLTLGGSYAYGTNIEGSDVDVRGCALNSKSDILGMSNFEQFVNTETDTTVYGFNKLITLLQSCNPNTIEMLGCRPEHYLYVSADGKLLIDNRKLFLSQRAANSFGGYATQQLRRLKNALARDRLPQSDNEEHIRKSMESALKAFEEKFTSFESGSVSIYTDVSQRSDLDREVYCDIGLKKYPARQFVSMMNVLSNVVGDYEKLNHRNKKKDDNHLNKHAMHLVRLYLMCLDILEKEEINTYREADRDFLLSIRGGAFQKDDGTYMSEFFEIVSDFERRLEYAKKNTSLPVVPNMKQIEEFVISINRKAIEV